MTKRQLIDEITMRNPTAKTEFLARFKEADLGAYLDHLIVARRPRLSGGGSRYAKYFVSAECMSGQAEQVRVETPPVVVRMPQPAPAGPVKEAAQTEGLPLEQGEPASSVVQPVLFTPRAANVNERPHEELFTPPPATVIESAHDEPIPIPESTWREESELLSPDAAVPAARAAARTGSPDVSSLEEQQERQEQQQDEGETLSPQQQAAEAPVGSYQGEIAPIVVFQGAGRQEQAPDALEEIGGLPSPYGQEFHGEGAAMNEDEDAPSADADEIEREEIAAAPTEADELTEVDEPIEADEPVEQDLPVEETVEEPAEESAVAEEPARKKAKAARKKREPVAVGAERETNNNQDSDSWLF